MRRPVHLLLAPALVATLTAADGYQPAPAPIKAVLDAPAAANLSLAPDGARALLVTPRRLTTLAELAQPMARLAGLRINPRTRGPHSGPRIAGLQVMDLPSGKTRAVALPAGLGFGPPRWSPDGGRAVLQATSPKGVELWILDARAARLSKVPGVALNAVLGSPVDWLPGGKSLLVKAVPAGQGPAPAAPEVPAGPRIQSHASSQGKAPVRTYQDLLQNTADEALFEHLAQSQLRVVDLATGASRPVGRPGLYAQVNPAPDGRHVLVSTLHRPYSYLVPYGEFPHRWEVWNLEGKVVHTLADLPLAEDIPIEGVRKGPRQIGWVPTEPATLHWTLALDDGDPKKEVPKRDRLLTLAAPFTGTPVAVTETEHRLMGAAWTEQGALLYRDFDRKRRWSRTFLKAPGAAPALLFDLSANDRYRDPGQPVSRLLANGKSVLRQDGQALWLEGSGATPQGNRPFLDRFDLQTRKAERLFRCAEGRLETVSGLRPDGSFLVRSESPTDPPNFRLHPAGQGEPVALTRFQDPTPQLRKIQKRLVKYKRPDGVDLSFTLYLPPDYKDGERRPALVWAYPLEFTDADTAGQVTGSPFSFSTLGGSSHLFMLLQGYVVLDNATMPVVGDPETVNNSFLEQVAASAKAAIDKAAELGVIDPARVAVGGHSYGAFMTANLLATTSLFRCGIARSGAYNRTLTPFGFQSERRTLWEAPEMYLKVSPFMKANRFNAPILLIHGEADNNAGTFPIQSERLFHALKGNNQDVRYVTLPLESHGYTARESVEHTLWEMGAWLDRHLKP